MGSNPILRRGDRSENSHAFLRVDVDDFDHFLSLSGLEGDLPCDYIISQVGTNYNTFFTFLEEKFLYVQLDYCIQSCTVVCVQIEIDDRGPPPPVPPPYLKKRGD